MAKLRGLSYNILSLSILQVINFTLTMVSLPYLTRVLKVESWGKVVFCMIIINYLVWFSNWGFYVGTTKNIAACRDFKEKVNSVFSATWCSQWLLTLMSCFVLVLISFWYREYALILISGIGIIIGNAMMPIWFLNGLELIRESAIFQILVKMLALPFYFLFINNEDDSFLYMLINSISAVIVGVLCLIWIRKKKIVELSTVKKEKILEELKINLGLFLTSLMANLNTSIVPTALGIFASPYELGLFNIADRARGAAVTILHPVTHALFPRMCHLFSSKKSEAFGVLFKLGLVFILSSLSISIFLFIFPEFVISILGGKEYLNGVDCMKWLAFSPFFTTLSAFLSYQILIPNSYFRGYYFSSFLALAINLSLSYVLIKKYSVIGASSLILMTEVAVFLLLFIYTVIKFKKTNG